MQATKIHKEDRSSVTISMDDWKILQEHLKMIP